MHLKTLRYRACCALSISLVAIAACSDTATPSDAGASDAAPPRADATPSDGSALDVAAADAAPPAVDAGVDSSVALKQCTDGELAAAPLATNGSDVSFFIDGGPNVYTNNCVRIPKGKDVGFYGNFAAHPLANNGEPGNPIPSLSTGNDSGRIVFPTAGKYSFHCTSHRATMYGTVLVEP